MSKAKRPKTDKSFLLPDPSEINKAVEAVTKGEVIDGQIVKEHVAPTPPKKKKAIGRPPATHNRKRTSVMVDPILWQRIKLIAVKKNMDISDILEMGIHAVLKKYKNID